ncbi:MAG: indole-3-glycerol-phosphate synthase [Phycisphaerales bacterium]|nr:indole-3-glycerol-phosphate synthase [Phycisphaerales bacterium]
MLHEILAHKRREIQRLGMADFPEPPLSRRDFREAISRPFLSFIAEVKRRSPSAGVLAGSVNPAAVALKYVEGGAAAISVLTDAAYFGGALEDLEAVARVVGVPLLCKDFILDERQVRRARAAGADACLLIAAALTEDELRGLMEHCRRYDMCPLVEVHNEHELEFAVQCGANVIGINNRNLTSMRIDLSTVQRLAPRVPDSCVLVAESGYTCAEEIAQLPPRVNAVLVGTALMRQADPAATLAEWGRMTRSVREADGRIPAP